ncbi:zinc finger and SCAN domain-containing protein 4 [Marmota flaviventris]|uniref:zinc finger and SCAN domain-containing protein 4 n=1 Tax=Marmota flaviventris TaxID=93162 RepID=UPI003A854C1C
MASNLTNSCQCKTSQNDFELENTEFRRTQGSAVQNGEIISEFSSSQLNSLPDNGNSNSRKELQRLHGIFHSWLQPEKHSKDEIISRLVLEQFMINGNCRDRSILKEKWESSGRNLEKLMEDLTDDCMEPPVLVRVHMQGQEALFSENMPLKEVIVHLKKQLSAENTTGENKGISFQAPQDTPLETRQGNEDKENACNNFWKNTQVNDSINCQGTQTPSLLIIQEDNCLRLEDGGASCENPHNSRRVVTPNSEKGPLEGPSYQNVPVEEQPEFLPTSDQSSSEFVPAHQSNKGNSTCEGHHEKYRGAQKSYKCKECPKIFRYLCHFLAHQRRHRNERPFVCAECQKGFFQVSDLHVHQMIHTKEKPFKCSICERSFSHKTNLRAHERIHTGEKPYTCSLCQRSYRQSSTYHRHLRIHQKIRLKSVSSTPKASSTTAPM